MFSFSYQKVEYHRHTNERSQRVDGIDAVVAGHVGYEVASQRYYCAPEHRRRQQSSVCGFLGQKSGNVRHCQSDESYGAAHSRGDSHQHACEQQHKALHPAHIDAEPLGIVLAQQQGVERLRQEPGAREAEAHNGCKERDEGGRELKLPSPHIMYDCTPCAVDQKFIMEMSELPAKLSMTPATSSMSCPGRNLCSARSRKVTAMAPMKAAAADSRNPPMAMPSPAALPPISNMATATPSAAPVPMPRMEGSARGLEKTVCMSSPAVASDAPARMAQKTCGRRDCVRMMLSSEPSGALPSKAASTSAAGMSMLPKNTLASVSPTSSKAERAEMTQP